MLPNSKALRPLLQHLQAIPPEPARQSREAKLAHQAKDKTPKLHAAAVVEVDGGRARDLASSSYNLVASFWSLDQWHS